MLGTDQEKQIQSHANPINETVFSSLTMLFQELSLVLLEIMFITAFIIFRFRPSSFVSKGPNYKAQWTYWKNVRRIDGVRKIYEKLTPSVRSKHSLLFPSPTSTTPYAHPYSIFSSNYCENCKNNSNQQKCSAIPNTFINFPSITQREHDDYSHRDEVTTQSHPRLHSNRNSW